MSTPENNGSLSDKFAGFGAMPSEGVWEGIATQLDEKSGRKVGFWWWFSGLAAIGLFAGWMSVSYYSMPPDQSTTTISQIEQNTEQEREAKPTLCWPEHTHFTYSASEQLLDESIETHATKHVKKENNIASSSDQIETKLIANNDDQKDAIHSKEMLPATQQLSLVDLMANTPIQKVDPMCTFPRCVDENWQKRFRPFEVGFRVGFYHDLAIAAPAAEVSFTSLSSDQSVPEIQGSNSLAESAGTTYPSFPQAARNINLDFVIGKYISNRWMLHSGLWFSRANYKSDYYSTQYSYSNTNISSFAIPVGASYDFIQKDRFEWRGQVNFINEFAVYENAKIDYNQEPSSTSSQFTKGYSAGFDFSLNHLIELKKGVHLNIAPSYRYYLQQHVQAAPFLLQKNHWVGGTVGMVWRL